ncbi:zinc metalloproteinase nas-13-like [Stegodyphus dumicola]|uniref:zinc metalloproteinase nas-13-like n=1 Tax=Stegodyphus dumicola TaxID=202533 RepID=UPI0015AE8295|nr:zinc metalloproteinase nas-13-like [Stegodyphus dumicola]
MLQFQNLSCIRFIPRSLEEDYIYITPNGGCASYVGRMGGEQTLSLGIGCYSKGIIMHELMHTLGFVHEQSRPDRDDFVTVHWENVKEGREGNFKKYDWPVIHLLKEDYDYSSILHYSRFAFSKDPKKKPTLEPKKKDAKIGQRSYLSKGDIRKINKLYQCKNHLSEQNIGELLMF